MVVMLAIGITTAVTVLAVVDGVLFRPLPYDEPGRLAQLDYLMLRGARAGAIQRLDYEALRSARSHIESIGLISGGPQLSYAGGAGVEEVATAMVSDSALTLLGVHMRLGRVFIADDERHSDDVAILTWSSWKRRFGGDSSILNQPVILGNRAVTIIGVLPSNFVFPVATAGSAEFVLLRTLRGAAGPQEVVSTAVARLRPAVSIEQAQKDVDDILSGIVGPTRHVTVTPLSFSLFSFPPGVLWVLVIAALSVLAVVCFNASAMLAASYVRRRRGLAVQVALGSGRLRVVRLLLCEAAALAICATGLGVMASYLAAEWLLGHLPIAYAGLVPAIVPHRIVLLGIGLPLLIVPVCGLGPALGATVSVVTYGIAPQSRPARFGPIGGALIVGQVALAVILTAGASLMVNSLIRLKAVDLGYDPIGSFALTLVHPGASRVDQSLSSRRSALEAIREIPGVQAAGMSDVLPMSGELSIAPQLQTARGAVVRWEVSAGFLVGVGARFVGGRDFTKAEEFTDAPVAIVGRSAAALLWPKQEPIGQLMVASTEPSRLVVGVIEDLRSGYTAPAEAAVYLPLRRSRQRYPVIVIRANAGLSGMMHAVRDTLSRIFPSSVVARPETLVATLNRGIENVSFPGAALVLMALLALGVSSSGIYGVSSQLAAAGAREMAIKGALGARPSHLRWTIVRRMIGPVAFGSVLGAVLSLSLTRYLDSILYNVGSTDPFSLGVATVTVLAFGFVAAFLPAYRASHEEVGSILRSIGT